MRRIMLLVTVALVTAALMAASALPTLADPAPPVGPHQHFLSTPNGVQRFEAGVTYKPTGNHYWESF
jgi:hypothetical protein